MPGKARSAAMADSAKVVLREGFFKFFEVIQAAAAGAAALAASLPGAAPLH